MDLKVDHSNVDHDHEHDKSCHRILINTGAPNMIRQSSVSALPSEGAAAAAIFILMRDWPMVGAATIPPNIPEVMLAALGQGIHGFLASGFSDFVNQLKGESDSSRPTKAIVAAMGRMAK